MNKILWKFFILITLLSVGSIKHAHATLVQTPEDTIAVYFKNFEKLSKLEKWEEIISQGKIALESAHQSNRQSDEALISTQLASTSFFMGNYRQALTYANRCNDLAREFDDPTLYIRGLCLISATRRAEAAKATDEETQQFSYGYAESMCAQAATCYSQADIKNKNLKGKIYFNWGAALADNPKGDLESAKMYYSFALDYFKEANARDDIIRTTIRLGKVYLLQNKYEQCQQAIKEVRSSITTERLSMHTDYLEAQLKFAQKDFKEASKIADHGLKKAKNLGAKEDASRLTSLLERVELGLKACVNK